MAATKGQLLGHSPGRGVWADATTRLRPMAHERSEAKSVIAPVLRLVPVRDDHPSKKRESQARVCCIRVILPDGPPPTNGTPLADAAFVARIYAAGSDPAASHTRSAMGRTDADGVLRLPLEDGEDRLVLEIAGRAIKVRAGALGRLDAAATPRDEQVKLRLYNLGYGAALPGTWTDAEYALLLALFQKQHGVSEEEWERVGPETLRALRRYHDGEEG